MRRLIIAGLAAALLAAPPASAQEVDYDAFDADLDEVITAFDEGLELADIDRAAAAARFEEMAAKAEAMLDAYPGLEERDRIDLHYQAGNGWYYAGENYQELAKHEGDAALAEAHKANMVEVMLKALAHHTLVQAFPEQPFNPAEYYFAASTLAAYGAETDDPRKVEWAEAEVKAARARVLQTERLDFMEPWPATAELIRALANYAEQSGDESALEEARALLADFPKDRWSYDQLAELLD